MTPAPSAATRLVALLGDPVAHSLSPRFHNAAFRAEGRDAVYLALRCDAARLPGLLAGIAAAGGAGNVTLPHKALAAGVVARRTAAVEATGACNTFWLEDGVLCGDNTDVDGVAGAMRALLGAPPADARVLLLGAGGAASAVLEALEQAGAAAVTVLNRTPARAAALAGRGSGRAAVTLAGSAAELRGERFDLAINATSLGLRDADPLPLEPDAGPAIAAALDLVYRPEETAWVRRLRERGLPAADGLEMLLQQGAAAYRRWWGGEPPLHAMRAALPPRPAARADAPA